MLNNYILKYTILLYIMRLINIYICLSVWLAGWPCAQLQVSIKILFPFDGEKYESNWKNKQKNFWPSVGAWEGHAHFFGKIKFGNFYKIPSPFCRL